MNQFHAGQQVVCIDDKVPIEGGGTVKDAHITEGAVYTIRWVGMTSHYVFGEYLGVRLAGIRMNETRDYGEPDCPYNARRFRPLVKDPIAVFRAILADPDKKIDAPEGPVRAPVPVRAPEKIKETVE